MNPVPRAGYTLPVFACASALAALRALNQPGADISEVSVDLVQPAEIATVLIEQLAPLPDGSVLAISRSDPGDNLDLTRHTPVWALVRLAPDQVQPLEITGGEGIGITGSDPAIYAYARQLFEANLHPLLQPDQRVRVTIILPEGRRLAQRTSNAAFGVLDGLSLLGTTGIAQPLSAPGQLDQCRQRLQELAQTYKEVVFCLGENGLDLATQAGIDPQRRLKTANWLGPLLVEAATLGLDSVLLFGYHGKLIKLAGGIFHTHHHIADARQEILAAVAAAQGLSAEQVQDILASPTTEAALTQLRTQDPDRTAQIYAAIARRIDRRAQEYVGKHCDAPLTVGSILFDRQRQIIVKSETGERLLQRCQADAAE